MEIIGKIIQAFPEVTGTSKAGNPWKKREYILETQETYPKKIFFDFFGDRADQFPLQVGQIIKLFFDIDSREYQGRWYTQIRAWKYEDPNQSAAQPVQAAQQPFAQPSNVNNTNFAAPAPAYGAPMPGAVPPPPAMGVPGGATDDLPF